MEPELDAALRELESTVSSKHRPSRHSARPVLVSLGEHLMAGRTAEAEEALGRLGRLPPEVREAFAAAVRDELMMACAEHVRSVDPRYLHHPDYDVEYTVAARRRLEARLRAAARLGIRPEDSATAEVLRADARLERRIADRIDKAP